MEAGEFPADTSNPLSHLPRLRSESGRRMPIALRKVGDPREALWRRANYGRCNSFG